MRKFFKILALSSLCILFGCTEKNETIPEWIWTDPEQNPGGSDTGEDNPGGGETGDEDQDGKKPTEPSFEGKPRYVWIDASANFQYYANDKDRIANDLKKIKKTGFTDVIVDVRPTEGTVLYRSKVAPETVELAAWVNGQYKFVKRTGNFDYLQAFIDAGHSVGLRVNAAMNTFVGGYGGMYGLHSVGPIFTGDIPSSWATVINSSDGLVSTYSQDAQGTVFLNPADPAVQEYVLKIIAEIAEYDVDGIILDRCRYDDNGLMCEFSDTSRDLFETYYGKKVENWPGGIFKAGTESLPSSLNEVQKSWLAFRAKIIHDFVEKASSKVHSINSKVRFGCYVGAWYSTYYTSGVNWASPKFDPYHEVSYRKWANADYAKYGYADHCDFMMLGCYASASSIYGSGEWTMEGFCKLGKKLLCGDTEFAGGPDVGNPAGWENGGQEALIPKTVDACINAADGYFCFDLCHIRMYDYWNAFKQGFDDYIFTTK